MVISASHNDYQENGIKIFENRGIKIDRKIEKMIENILSEEITSLPSLEIGKAKRIDESGPRNIEFCKSAVPDEISFTDLRIILDGANGASYKGSPEVFRE
jgi:Phosphomannomutase